LTTRKAPTRRTQRGTVRQVSAVDGVMERRASQRRRCKESSVMSGVWTSSSPAPGEEIIPFSFSEDLRVLRED
jgi:hypothetical protein